MSAFDWAARFGHTAILSFLKNVCPGVLRTWKQQELFGRQVVGTGNGNGNGNGDGGGKGGMKRPSICIGGGMSMDTEATFGFGGIGPTGVYSLHIHNDSRSLFHYWDRHRKRGAHGARAPHTNIYATSRNSNSQFGNSERNKGHPLTTSSSRGGQSVYYESNMIWYWAKYWSGKLKLHACFSGNRWLSSYVPYLTAVSFG